MNKNLDSAGIRSAVAIWGYAIIADIGLGIISIIKHRWGFTILSAIILYAIASITKELNSDLIKLKDIEGDQDD